MCTKLPINAEISLSLGKVLTNVGSRHDSAIQFIIYTGQFASVFYIHILFRCDQAVDRREPSRHIR